MAKKPEPEKPVESELGYGDEEESESEESGEEEEGDSSEEIIHKPEPAAATASAIKKPQPPHEPSSTNQPLEQEPSSSSEEEDSESDAESEQPTASKSMDERHKSNIGAGKPPSKPPAPEPITPSKRPAEQLEANKDGKRLKMKVDSEATPKLCDSSKKVLIQRIWSEEDEIVLLKGMIEYEARKKCDPIAKIDAFLDFIKKDLQVNVSKSKLCDKIRRLKKKFENNKSRGRTMQKPHEIEAYGLSQAIWENNEKELLVGNTNGSHVVRNGRSDVEVTNGAGAAGEWKLGGRGVLSPYYGGLSVEEERMLRIGTHLFEGDNEMDGRREWDIMLLEEMEDFLKKLDVRRSQTKLVVDGLKSRIAKEGRAPEAPHVHPSSGRSRGC